MLLQDLVNTSQQVASTPGRLAKVRQLADLLKRAQPERIEALMKQVYTRRVGAPEEVAETIRWLALEAPVTINGAVIDITDGCFLR